MVLNCKEILLGWGGLNAGSG